MSLVLRRVEVEGSLVDVRIDGGLITDVGGDLTGDEEIEGHGGALIPGLHDHHIHLFATAAAADSVDVSGDALATLWGADATLPPGAWIRAVGWHEAGDIELDRRTLDFAVPGRPVRVQHATGALWVLNTPALDAVGLADHPDGRLFGMDAFLRDRLGGEPPSLAPLGAQLARMGVTAVTDATPYDRLDDVRRLVAAGVPQRLTVTGAPELDLTGFENVGPAKIVVADHDLPSVEYLAGLVATARRRGRNVAFHCASRVALVLTLAALADAGSRPGDRIEHGAVIPDDAIADIVDMGLTVVTQPALVATRGDRWRAEVEADDRLHLWRCGSLLRAGVVVAAGSDAPHGPVDPWLAMKAAVDRRTANGHVLGEGERISARDALALYHAGRRVAPGQPADLCLLAAPLDDVLADPDASAVRLTLVAGVRA